jgi:hypothetical protein
MKISNNLGMILLAIWLILTGLLPLLSISIPGGETLLAILAIAAGVLILLGPARLTGGLRSMRGTRNWGMLLLGIWLILAGLLPLLSLSIPAEATILALLAVAAGVLILLGR